MLSNKGLEYTIRDVGTNKVLVTFAVTGWSYETRKDHALNGAVRDPLDRYKYGVGFTGNGPFNVRHPAFSVWKNMFDRVYDNGKFPDYTGCSIVCEWCDYQNFAAWYCEKHPGKPSYEMDKDLLKIGNKVYGPETCCIIPGEVNQAIVTVKSGKFPGIKKYHNKGRANISTGGGEVICKYFYMIEEAQQFYIEHKDIRIKGLALKYKDYLKPLEIKALSEWSTKDRLDHYFENKC